MLNKAKVLISLVTLIYMTACGPMSNQDHLKSYCNASKPNPKKSSETIQWVAFLDADDSSLVTGCYYSVGSLELTGTPSGNTCKVTLSGAAGTGTMTFTRTTGVTGLSWKTSTSSGTLPCYNGYGSAI